MWKGERRKRMGVDLGNYESMENYSLERTFDEDVDIMFAAIREVSVGIENRKIQRDIQSQPTWSGRMATTDKYIELSDRMRALGNKVLSMSVYVSDIVEL